MRFEKEKDEKPNRTDDWTDWEGNSRLCPECEGRGFVYHSRFKEEKELCLTCDGLGVVYD